MFTNYTIPLVSMISYVDLQTFSCQLIRQKNKRANEMIACDPLYQKRLCFVLLAQVPLLNLGRFQVCVVLIDTDPGSTCDKLASLILLQHGSV